MGPRVMFSRKKPEAEDRKMSDAPDDLGIPMKPARAAGQSATVAPLGRTPAPAAPPPRPMEPPRPVEPPRAADVPLPRPAPAAPPRRSEGEARKLIVGREISLSGEITSCDRLIVEGSVEANLQNCHEVDIAESGLFKGSATIDEAEVRGRFEGNLIVRKRLLIRATGRVSGTIRYGQIEVECGGQITGEIQAHASDEFAGETGSARIAF
ncbi:MAG TPA: polymer-forming cytoskeletal protein [Stellaceae bacterium]|nr:polymer-forming cytoskeletal protein [Stellaceae bacterium]